MKKFSSTTRENSRRTLRKDRIRTILFVGIALVLVFFIAPRILSGIGALIFTPIAHFETWFYESGSAVPLYFQERSALIEENTRLKKDLAHADTKVSSRDRLLEENMELRSLLGSGTSTRIAAGVIGRPTAMPFDVLILDKGHRDGIQADAPVYVGTDHVVGFVSEVHPHSSVVVLASTPGLKSTAYIFGPNIYTTAEGLGGGVLKVSVPQGILISVGDLVVIPSFDTGVYGRLSLVESVPTEPEQRGYVTQIVPLQSIRFVSVGTSPLSPLSFEEATEVVSNVREDLLTIPVPEGVLIDVVDDTGTTAATSTPTTTPSIETNDASSL